MEAIDSSKMVAKLPQELRGRVAESFARIYMSEIQTYGGLENSENDEITDEMDACLNIAKAEYKKLHLRYGLERLGYLFIEADRKGSAIECFEAVGKSLSKKSKLELENLKKSK